MTKIQTKVYKHGIKFKDKTSQLITENGNNQIIKESGEKSGIYLEGKYIDFNMIARILPIEEFFNVYPQEVEKHKQPKQIVKPSKSIYNVTALWVKKDVLRAKWESFYSKIQSYCLLSSGGQTLTMGFLVASINGNEELPDNCFRCDDRDLWKIQKYREANNIYPLPLN